MDRLIAILIAGAILAVPLQSSLWKACACCTGVQFPLESMAAGDANDQADACCILSEDAQYLPEEQEKEQPCDQQDCPMTCCSATISFALSINAVDSTEVEQDEIAFQCFPTIKPNSRHVAELKRPPRPMTLPC